MTRNQKIAAGTGGVLALAAGAFFLLGNKAGDLPGLGNIIDREPATCPLGGLEPKNEALLERPAVAVKIENASVAYPLSGLEEAEVVYEELVEGGVTRFMAIYHCNDSDKAGPVRSARLVDPAIMRPYTRILVFSGANQAVLNGLDEAGIVQIEENAGTTALERIAREGISSEHTLYAHTAGARKLGKKGFGDPPAEDLFEFGELEPKGRKASTITIDFSGATTITYEFSDGGWLRSQASAPFMAESGEQIAPTNVLIEEHEVNLSDTITDVAGNPSVEVGDPTGSGRAVLFRDGRAIVGRWTRESEDDPVSFETKAGDRMMFAPGSIWIELVPSDSGEVKGSFSFEK
jgi:hypothetical protein